MASEQNDINDIVKKCKILLLDIEGTTTSISFVKDKLFPYAEQNVKEFLDSQWETDDVKQVISALRKLALEDQENSVDGVVTIPGEDATKDEQIEGLVKSVKWQMSADRKVGALKQLQGLIWKQGYDKGDIQGHVYDDVSPALDLWRSGEGQKVYIYSSGSVQAQKLLFGQSMAGDLLKYIDGHFDTAVGAKQEAASYAAITEQIGCKAEEILFLTDIVKEAEAARESGLCAALVSREGNSPLPAAPAFPVLHSLAQLAPSNKRKPADQDVQPAKVPKTDIDDDVKTKAEVVKAPEPVTNAVSDEPEKMEVEEEVVATDPSTKAPVVEAVEKIETVVEEITDVNEVVDAPVCDIEPIIEESIDKTEPKETEMETETVKESVSLPKDDTKVENADDKAPVAEETPPTVITEIEDVTNVKESLADDAEIIEDIVPVIEEPTAISDMDELQNVGEVLDKECDEILSKVEDVTNLDNIPLKPLLNTIVEESMETENTDSNDIVERILDSELELEMQQITDSKTEVAEGKKEEPIIADQPSAMENLVPEEAKDSLKETMNVDNVATQNNTEKTDEAISHTKVEVEEKQDSDKEKTVENNLNINEKKEEEEIVKVVDSEHKMEDNVKTAENNADEENKAKEKVEVKINQERAKSTAVQENSSESNLKTGDTQVSNPDKTETIVAQESKVTEESIVKEQEIKGDDENKVDSKENKIEEITENNEQEMKEEKNQSPAPTVEAKMEEHDESQSCSMETDQSEAKTKTVTVQESMETETAENKESLPGQTTMETDAAGVKELPTDQGKMETEIAEVKELRTTEKEAIQETETPAEQKTAETKILDVKESQTEQITMETETVVPKETIVSEEVKVENGTTETQVNGKTTNGDAEAGNLNGDASKEDELSARLSNGKETVNGTNGNGDSNETERPQTDSSVDKEIPDIKVKTVTTDEPRNELIEQPTEA